MQEGLVDCIHVHDSERVDDRGEEDGERFLMVDGKRLR